MNRPLGVGCGRRMRRRRLKKEWARRFSSYQSIHCPGQALADRKAVLTCVPCAGESGDKGTRPCRREGHVADDLIVVGGGIAGASLARRMAEGGARVVVLERETEFRDRIRGEALVPWGVGEARQLGVVDILRSCAQEMRWVQLSINGQVAMKRD